MPTAFVSFRPAVRQLPTFLLALSSCGLSFWFTLRFCGGFSPDMAPLELYATGATWEGAKLTFTGIGVCDFAARRWWRGTFLLAMSAVLAAGSIVASLAFVADVDIQSRARMLASSPHYLRLQANFKELGEAIDTRDKSAAEDTTQGYRERGNRSSGQADILRGKQDKVAAEMQERETAVVAQNDTQHLCQIIFALMLELVSLTAMALLSSVSGRPSERPALSDEADVGSILTPPSTVVCIKKVAACVGRGDTSTDVPGKRSRYLRAKRQIMRGELRPVYRDLMTAIGVSQRTAQRYLSNMLADGVLHRQGRQYRRTAQAA
jgi:hypothetical protein